MPWKHTATVETMEVGYDARPFGAFSVFRGAQCVFGWRKDSNQLAWMHALPRDALFGMKHLVTTPGAAITLNKPGLGEPKSLLWLDPVTGAVQQEHIYTFEPSQEGFAAAADFLFLHGRTPENRWALMRISADTGKVLEQGDAPIGLQLRATSQRLYLGQQQKALFHTPLDRVQWTQANLQGVTSISLWDDQLYFFLAPTSEQAYWELVWWQANEARVMGRARMETNQALIVKPGPQAGIVIAHALDLGLWLMDLGEGTCRWKLALAAGEKLKAALWTPHGLVTAIKVMGSAARLELRDSATGEVRETLPCSRYDIAHLYWMEERLIASAFDGLESFAWE
jgi:hypothetical protein